MRYHGHNSDGEPMSSAFVHRDEAQLRDPSVNLDCSSEPSLTRQEFADECDINKLMAQYEKSGIISHINPRTPQYLDLSEVPDLATAHQIIQNATAEFMALPANVRREFDNDPMEFIRYAENPDNIEKMREWGLAKPAPAKEEAPPPPSVAPAPEPAPAPAPTAK